MSPVTPAYTRLLRHIESDEATGCWNWQGKANNSGYGQIGSGGRNGRDVLTHRVAYEHVHGPIPLGLEVDHKCRNRLCCNPDHLEAVTRSENMLRGTSPNFVTKRTGICKRGHSIAGSNALLGRDGRTRCRECTNERKRRYWHADLQKKAAAQQGSTR